MYIYIYMIIGNVGNYGLKTGLQSCNWRKQTHLSDI